MHLDRWAPFAILIMFAFPTNAFAQDGPATELESVKQIESFGGRIQKISRAAGGPVIGVYFVRNNKNRNASRFGDDDVDLLLALPKLARVSLYSTDVSDAGIVALKGIKSLTHLNLTNTRVGDACCRDLAAIESLEFLTFDGTGITDVGLRELRLSKRLNGLSLSDCAQITDASLAEVSKLTGLMSLHINQTNISDEGLKSLRNVKGLRILSISGTQISDAGLTDIGAMRDLTYLDLENTQISDAGLKKLAGLSKLESIMLRGTGATKAGIDDLKRAIPSLQEVDVSDKKERR
jgi:Leucine-rich repeat (LRR) protein